MINTSATLLFNPEQTEFFTFRDKYGFIAVRLRDVEAIRAEPRPDSRGQLSRVDLYSKECYESFESVPELVARFCEISDRARLKEETRLEVLKQLAEAQNRQPTSDPLSVKVPLPASEPVDQYGLPLSTVTTVEMSAPLPAPSSRSSIWKK